LKIAIIATHGEDFMKCVSAKDAKNGFGRLLDTARAEPVIIEKHGRAVIVVLAIEEYERLVAADASDQPMARTARKMTGRRGK
jgi:prevent-host-death family protein